MRSVVSGSSVSNYVVHGFGVKNATAQAAWHQPDALLHAARAGVVAIMAPGTLPT